MDDHKNMEKVEAVESNKKPKKKKVMIGCTIALVIVVLLLVGLYYGYTYLKTVHITGIQIVSEAIRPDSVCVLERGEGSAELGYKLEAERNSQQYPRLAGYFEEVSQEEIQEAVDAFGIVSWESSDTNVVIVDENGLVTTTGKGDAEVFVKISSFLEERGPGEDEPDDGEDGEDEQIIFSDSRKFHVTVTPVGLETTEEIKFKKYKEQQQIDVHLLPEDADYTSLVFTSDNDAVATVDETGLVTAVKAGKCKIITVLDDKFESETSVTVPEPEPVYPLSYSDSGVDIKVYKEKYAGSWVYAAHVQMRDYSRLGTHCANGKYGGGKETTSHAAKRVGAILAINGDWSAPHLDYPVIRSGVLCNNKGALWCPAVYSRNTGLLINAWETGGTPGYAGADMGSLVASGAVTDTFSFGPPMLVGGTVVAGSSGGRAQRTFIGSSGAAGDIWLCVADGRHNDGVSPGLTYGECASFLQSKGCSFGVPLDGGGSSTMVWKGRVLNAQRGHERAVVDFVCVK